MKLNFPTTSFKTLVAETGLTIPAAVIGLLIAIGMIWSANVYSRTKIILAREEITVKGVANQDVTADYGTWKITISAIDADRATSLKKMEQQQQVVNDYIKQFPAFSTRVGIPTTLESYDYEGQNRKFNGYASTVSFSITSSNVDQLHREATAFNRFAVENNLDIKANTADFYCSGLDSLKITLLEQAVADAKARAKALSSSSDTKIGKVKSASQGVFQVNERNNFDVSAGGNFNTESKDKTVQATVDITFELL